MAHAFNDTLARVEDAVGEMRQFSTALAHELRTPIAALRGEIELGGHEGRTRREEHRETAASQLEELDKLKRLIDQLLTLARAESGQIPLAHERVELGALSSNRPSTSSNPVAQAQGLALLRNVASRPAIAGDAAWMERLLLNLLDNAFKFTPSGGVVTREAVGRRGLAILEVRTRASG